MIDMKAGIWGGQDTAARQRATIGSCRGVGLEISKKDQERRENHWYLKFGLTNPSVTRVTSGAENLSKSPRHI